MNFFLYSLIFNLCCFSLFAQDGELVNLQFDSTVEQGQTELTFTFDYMASETGTVEWQLITANPDGSPAWGQYNFGYIVLNIDAADSLTTMSFTYDVPSDAELTTYTWAGKITLNGTDLGYNNTGNLVEVTENGGMGGNPTGELASLVFDTLVQQGQTGLTFTFDYMASDTGTVEWQLIAANPDGSPAWGQYSFGYILLDIDATDTLTTMSFTYDVPPDAELITYTWAGKVTLDGMDLGYNNVGNLVEVEMLTNIDSPLENEYSFKVYPNPVVNNLFIEGENENAVFRIFNELGQLVLINKEIGTQRSIDLSNFPDGVYQIKPNFGKTLTLIKQ